MSGTFIAVALVVAVLLVFWRLTLVVAAALLITMLITGMNVITDGVRAVEQATTSITRAGELPTSPTPVTPH